MRRDRIVVALEHKVLSYNFADLKLLHQIETLGNSRGLLALSSTADSTVLACPGLHTGQVRGCGVRPGLWQQPPRQPPLVAYGGAGCMSVSGSWRADASWLGSLAHDLLGVCSLCLAHTLTRAQVRIELYDRKQTKFISAHNAPLVCLTLSMDGKRLATASDKGTLVRVWNTADGQLLQVRARTHAHQQQRTGTRWSLAVVCCQLPQGSAGRACRLAV